MRSTDELREEHDALLLMLRILERFAAGIERGAPTRGEDGAAIIDFLRAFGDRCHHAKEEDCLFPLVERMGIPAGPEMATLRREHREARALVNGMADGLGSWRSGDLTGGATFGRSAMSYRNLMGRHIDNENDLIFPEVDRAMTPEQDAKLVHRFQALERERIGAGKHEECHRLLAELERNYLGEAEPQPAPPERRSTMPGERHGESL